MQNETGSGPTRSDKTLERMAQERQSPGASSAGGHAADAPENDTRQAVESSEDSVPSFTSANTAARRGDVALTAAPDDTRAAAHAGREARIRQAAYRLFEGRSDADGGAVMDWLRAEIEVDAADRDGVDDVDGGDGSPAGPPS